MSDDPPQTSPSDGGEMPEESAVSEGSPTDPPDAEPSNVDASEDTVSATDDSLDTEEYTTSRRTLDPRVRWIWAGRAVIVGFLFGVIPTVISLVVAPEFVWVGPTIFVLATVLGVVHALFLYRSWEYHVREDSMYLDRGVLTKVQTVVPYVRVQHIDTSRGPIERLAGLSSLVVYTAGSRGADVTVPGLTPEEAADLQTRLKALAIESEGEDAV